ncbi:MAG: hypothetical protein M1433_00725 [Candidatus Parvarchaeota archaeon]|nr:hypothetical protein [Candidatus Parvarchaeota archaeon]
MANYYLDIETTGLDQKKDKIITIQYQQIDSRDASPVGELKILKEWVLREKGVLKKFLEESGISESNPFSFIPVGFNLTFEHKFLLEKTKKYKLGAVDILLNRPFIDLKPMAVIMNNGSFKGSGLDKITGKPHDGSEIPELYAKGKYGDIISYIERETEEYLKFANWIYKKLPSVLEEFKKENNIKK